MQQTQNCGLCFLALLVLLVPGPSVAARTIKPDPLLNGTSGPCDPKLEGPDYVAGTDVDGNPVAAADLPQAKIPAPSGILVPLGNQAGRGKNSAPKAYAELSQKDVDSILNPKPACPPQRRTR